MSTIIQRVVETLQGVGRDDEAGELIRYMTGLKAHVENLMELLDVQSATVREYINAVQARCQHPVFCLGDEAKSEIACYTCGHTVCDEKTYKFAQEVAKGWGIRSSLHHKGGRRFTLPLPIRNELGKKLIVEEIAHGEVQQTALRSTGDGTGSGPTSGIGVHGPEGGEGSRRPIQDDSGTGV
jgi:hypothetical protein